MKQFWLMIIVAIFCISSVHAQDLVKGRLDTSLIDQAIAAINNQKIDYFEKHLAESAVWLDEDGHAIAGKRRVSSFIQRSFMRNERKIGTQNVKMFTSGDSTWGYFNYEIQAQGETLINGLSSVVFKKIDTDWQIVLIHGAHNVSGHH